MAITFGNVSHTSPHNNNGTFLDISVTSTTNDVSAVTYGGAAMTSRGVVNNAVSGRYVSLWTLDNPAAGSNAVAITGGTSTGFRAQSYSGAASSPVGNISTAGATSSTATVSVMTFVDGAYVIAHGQCRDFSSNGTNTTTLNQGDAINTLAVWRTTAAVSPAGTGTITVNTTGSEWDLIGYALNPAFPVDTMVITPTFNNVDLYYIAHTVEVETMNIEPRFNDVRLSYTGWSDTAKSSTTWTNRQQGQ